MWLFSPVIPSEAARRAAQPAINIFRRLDHVLDAYRILSLHAMLDSRRVDLRTAEDVGRHFRDEGNAQSPHRGHR